MSLLVLGATSAIAKRTTAYFARAGHNLYLAGRHTRPLERLAKHYRTMAEIEVEYQPFDATKIAEHPRFIEHVLDCYPNLDYALVAFGDLGTPEAFHDPLLARQVIDANFTGAASLLTLLADHFETMGRGNIIVIGSVAGDRGRKSNYVYGAAKAGLEVFTQGLRNRLADSNVRVLTVKPGFVDTPMTQGMNLPAALVSDADRVGRKIYLCALDGKDVIYAPWYWRWIMLIIKNIPEFLFKKMSI